MNGLSTSYSQLINPLRRGASFHITRALSKPQRLQRHLHTTTLPSSSLSHTWISRRCKSNPTTLRWGSSSSSTSANKAKVEDQLQEGLPPTPAQQEQLKEAGQQAAYEQRTGRPQGQRRQHASGRYQTAEQAFEAKNRRMLLYTSAVVVFFLGGSYAAVPLYRMFCAATGFAGTPKTGMNSAAFTPEQMVPAEGVRRIKVKFNADKSETLPWTFSPSQRYVSVLPGESSLAFYTAKNKSDEDIVGIATYNVAPDKAAAYFSKVECFCFDEQKLLAGEEVDMPLLFFIDKDILDDPTCKEITEVILSYTFFRARRTARGDLVPDAPDAVVNNSMGWGAYQHAPKKEASIEEVS